MPTTEPHGDPDKAPRPRGGLGRLRLILWGLVALCALIGIIGWALKPADAPMQRVADSYADALGGKFDMVDQTGRTVTQETLKGRPYAIFFGFTRCPDVCPTTLSRMAALRKRLGADGDRFDIVFVSVDPGHDTRTSIGEYVKLFGTPIIGLTGTDAQTDRIVKAFKIYYKKVPVEGGDYTVDHTASVFLMDRAGKFVTTIDHKEGQDVALEKLRRIVA
jgi:protein SCO1/2